MSAISFKMSFYYSNSKHFLPIFVEVSFEGVHDQGKVVYSKST